MIQNKSIWNELKIVKARGDGHCLLHAVVMSLEYQYNEICDVEFVKHQIIKEIYDNMSFYQTFLNCISRCDVIKLMTEYINEKKYNNDFCDIVPYVIAKSLNVGLIIVNDYLNANSIHTVVIESGNRKDKWLTICRNNLHYDGIQYLHNIRTVSRTENHDLNVTQLKPKFSQCNSANNLPKKDNVNKDSSNVSMSYVKSLNKKICKHKGLNMMHVNCRSLLPKLEEISLLIKQTNVDVMCITETWLDEHISNDVINVDGYSIIRKDRKDKKGGGVLIYVNSDIVFKEREDLVTSKDLEMIWIEIFCENTKNNHLVSCVYRPPNVCHEYLNHIVDCLEKAHAEDKYMSILGDMNINYLLDENIHENPIFMMENLFNLKQLIDKPTRVTEKSSTLIDIILTNCPENHTVTGVQETAFSDHYIIFTKLNITSKGKIHNEIRFRNFHNFNAETFLHDIASEFNEIDILSDNIRNEFDFESKWQLWKKKFISISNKHAPFRVSRLKNRTNKWMTPDIIKMIHKRDYLHKKAIQSNDKSKSSDLWNEYRKLRNLVTLTIRKQKQTYFDNINKTLYNKPKELWSELNNVFPKPKNDVSNDISPDEFNNFFSSIGKKVADSVKNNDNFEDYYSQFPNSIHEFSFREIDINVIESFLAKLPTSSKNDVLDFDTSLLNLSSGIIAGSLCVLINASLKLGYCPADWKLARVTPAYKGKGSSADKSNYRPLSVIGSLAKLMEKCVQTQLVNYLMKHNFISIDQFAYIKHHSTQTCLNRLLDDVLENINENETTAMCFLDIKKCFDTIDHELLCFKLNKYGIRNNELKWFKSYLSNRTQVVVNNTKVSKKEFLNIGVPQGTVLGPILFLIYVNDLSNVISNANINIYADDVVVYASNSNVNTLQIHMQDIMNKVFNWYSQNKLTLSVDKCSTMVINDKLNKPVPSLKIKLDDKDLAQVSSMKYLGVTIDNRLKWSQHLSNITKKVQFANSKIKKTAKALPVDLRLKYFNASCIPIMDYACTVWGHFSNNVKQVINRLEHMSARCISGNYDFVNCRGSDIMKQLNMTYFENRLNYYHCLLTFKAIHGLVPYHIANKIIFEYEVSQRNLRTFNEMNLYKPKPKCEIFKKSFSYHGPDVWNKLPYDIKNVMTVNTFKKSYKSTFPLNVPL